MSLELNLNNIENKLSYLSLYPVVWPGLLKVGIGITQLVTAVAISVIFFVPACLQFEDSQKLFCRAIKHIVHGMGNIVAGALEAIPIIGTIVVGIRFFKVDYHKNPVNDITTTDLILIHPAFKFLPYKENKIETFIEGQRKLMEEHDSGFL